MKHEKPIDSPNPLYTYEITPAIYADVANIIDDILLTNKLHNIRQTGEDIYSYSHKITLDNEIQSSTDPAVIYTNYEEIEVLRNIQDSDAQESSYTIFVNKSIKIFQNTYDMGAWEYKLHCMNELDISVVTQMFTLPNFDFQPAPNPELPDDIRVQDSRIFANQMLNDYLLERPMTMQDMFDLRNLLIRARNFSEELNT